MGKSTIGNSEGRAKTANPIVVPMPIPFKILGIGNCAINVVVFCFSSRDFGVPKFIKLP